MEDDAVFKQVKWKAAEATEQKKLADPVTEAKDMNVMDDATYKNLKKSEDNFYKIVGKDWQWS